MPPTLLASHALASSSSSSAASLLLRATYYSPAFGSQQRPLARHFSSSPHRAAEPASSQSPTSSSQQAAAAQLQKAGEGVTEGPHFRGASRLLSVASFNTESPTLTSAKAAFDRQHTHHPVSFSLSLTLLQPRLDQRPRQPIPWSLDALAPARLHALRPLVRPRRPPPVRAPVGQGRLGHGLVAPQGL